MVLGERLIGMAWDGGGGVEGTGFAMLGGGGDKGLAVAPVCSSSKDEGVPVPTGDEEREGLLDRELLDSRRSLDNAGRGAVTEGGEEPLEREAVVVRIEGDVMEGDTMEGEWIVGEVMEGDV